MKLEQLTEDEKDLLFLSLNSIAKDERRWHNLGTCEQHNFYNLYKKLAKGDNSKFNIFWKLEVSQ